MTGGDAQRRRKMSTVGVFGNGPEDQYSHHRAMGHDEISLVWRSAVRGGQLVDNRGYIMRPISNVAKYNKLLYCAVLLCSASVLRTRN